MKELLISIVIGLAVTGIFLIVLRANAKDRVEVIGEITGACDKVGMARTNALFEVGLFRMGYKWVEVRGGSNGKPYYVVGHTRGHIPKNYIGNAAE